MGEMNADILTSNNTSGSVLPTVLSDCWLPNALVSERGVALGCSFGMT